MRVALAGIAILTLAACKSGSWSIPTYEHESTFQFNEMQFVSAFPATKRTVDGQDRWVRACGDDVAPTGVLLAVNLVGTQADSGPDATVRDNDVSIRPGDVVKSVASTSGGTTAVRFVVEEGYAPTASQFRVSLDCLEPYPDADLTGNQTCNAGLGVANPGGVQKVAPDRLRYNGLVPPDPDGFYPRTFLQDNAIGVAILVDQSGSMKGFVEKASKVEVAPDISPVPFDGLKFAQWASDRNNQRLSAVQYLLAALNARDKAILFQFGEKLGPTASVVCYNPDGLSEDQLRADCFGTNRGQITGCDGTSDCGNVVIESELAKMQPSARGRTPLWAAAADVYDFLKKNELAKSPSDRTQVLHVVIIGDGPDTCAPDSPDYLPRVHYQDKDGKNRVADQGLCATSGYGALRDTVNADLADPTVPKIHLNFVQFQAPGYLERDPRQQELACLTGGQYLFINSEDLDKSQDQALETVLKEAVAKIRYALSGAWELGLPVPDLQGTKLPRGAEIAIGGTITLVGKEASLVPYDAVTALRVGDADPSNPVPLPRFDTRGAIRLPCTSGDNCAWYPGLQSGSAPAPYSGMLAGCADFACVDGSRVCGARPKGDDTVCNVGGTAGICCAQGCWAGGTGGECHAQ